MAQNSLQITVLKLVFSSTSFSTARGSVSECGRNLLAKQIAVHVAWYAAPAFLLPAKTQMANMITLNELNTIRCFII